MLCLKAYLITSLLLLAVFHAAVGGTEIRRDCQFKDNKLRCELYTKCEMMKFINAQHSNYNLEYQSEDVPRYLEYLDRLKALFRNNRNGQDGSKKALEELLRLNSDTTHDECDNEQSSEQIIRQGSSNHLSDAERAPTGVDFSRHRALKTDAKAHTIEKFKSLPKVPWPSIGLKEWDAPGLGRSLFQKDQNDVCQKLEDYKVITGKRMIYRCGLTTSSVSIVFYGRTELNYVPYFRSYFISYPGYNGEYIFPRNPSMRFGEVYNHLSPQHKMFVHVPVPLKIVAKTATRSRILSNTHPYVQLAKGIIASRLLLCLRGPASLPYEAGHTSHCVPPTNVEIEPQWLVSPTERYKESYDGELFILAYAVFEVKVLEYLQLHKQVEESSATEQGPPLELDEEVLFKAFIRPANPFRRHENFELPDELKHKLSQTIGKLKEEGRFSAEHNFAVASGYETPRAKYYKSDTAWLFVIDELSKIIQTFIEENCNQHGSQEMSTAMRNSPSHSSDPDPYFAFCSSGTQINSLKRQIHQMKSLSNPDLNKRYIQFEKPRQNAIAKARKEKEKAFHESVTWYKFYVWPAKCDDNTKPCKGNMLGFKTKSSINDLINKNGILVQIPVRRPSCIRLVKHI